MFQLTCGLSVCVGLRGFSVVIWQHKQPAALAPIRKLAYSKKKLILPPARLSACVRAARSGKEMLSLILFGSRSLFSGPVRVTPSHAG